MYLEQCSCPPGTCAKGVEPARDCVARLPGGVESTNCEACGGETWHHQGACVPCSRKAPEEQPGHVHAEGVMWKPDSDPLGFVVAVRQANGNEFSVPVTDKKLVIRILKMLLEVKQ